jgi:hypothetical protein
LSFEEALNATLVFGSKVAVPELVEVGLDQARTRPLAILPAEPKLSDLDDLGPQRLTNGEHWLTVTQRTASAAPASYTLVRFGIGHLDSAPQGPFVRCLRPAGTYYGETSVPFEIATNAFAVRGVRIRARLSALFEAKPRIRQAFLTDDSPRQISGLTVGDYRIDLVAVGPDERELPNSSSRASCEITVNAGGKP